MEEKIYNLLEKGVDVENEISGYSQVLNINFESNNQLSLDMKDGHKVYIDITVE